MTRNEQAVWTATYSAVFAKLMINNPYGISERAIAIRAAEVATDAVDELRELKSDHSRPCQLAEEVRTGDFD